MKIFILTVLILLITFISESKSQLIRGRGFKLGLSSTNQDWNYSPSMGIVVNSKARTGLDAACFFEWLDIPFFSALTEIHFIQKGADHTTNLLITDAAHPDGIGKLYTISSHINYLSIPLMAKIRFDGGLFTPYAFVGPRFDFYLSSKDNSAINFNKQDIGGTIGIGVESASILPNRVGIEYRYSPNFRDSRSLEFLTVRNRSMEFLLVLTY